MRSLWQGKTWFGEMNEASEDFLQFSALNLELLMHTCTEKTKVLGEHIFGVLKCCGTVDTYFVMSKYGHPIMVSRKHPSGASIYSIML